MAMIDPPIEELFKKATCKYALASVVSKRAKALLVERPEFFRDNQKIKPIEFASSEFYNGQFSVDFNREEK